MARQTAKAKTEYIVLENFQDVETEHLYQAGDNYPHHHNVKVAQDRLDYLAGAENVLGRPIIKIKGE